MVQHLNWVTYSCNWETILIQMKNTTGVDFSLLSTNSVCSFCYDHVDHIIMHSTSLTTNPPPPAPDSWNPLYWDKATTPSLRILPLMIFSGPVRREGFVFNLWRKFCLLWTFCPNPALSSVNSYWPNAFVPCHEYLANMLLLYQKILVRITVGGHANIKLNFGRR